MGNLSTLRARTTSRWRRSYISPLRRARYSSKHWRPNYSSTRCATARYDGDPTSSRRFAWRTTDRYAVDRPTHRTLATQLLPDTLARRLLLDASHRELALCDMRNFSISGRSRFPSTLWRELLRDTMKFRVLDLIRETHDALLLRDYILANSNISLKIKRNVITIRKHYNRYRLAFIKNRQYLSRAILILPGGSTYRSQLAVCQMNR